MQEPDIIQFAFSIAVLIFSVVAHEVSHGYMAQYLGDPTARLSGRLTMNPLKHLDPIGSVLVPVVTALTFNGLLFGWAKPVPYNPYNLRDQKWGDSKVALAGPLTNLGIAIVFGLLVRAIGPAVLSLPMLHIMNVIIWTNIILAIFNLIPIPPLDGSKVLFNILPLRFRYIEEYFERYAMVIILLFVLFIWPLIWPHLYPILASFQGLLTGV